jgi:hypothetical protein
MAMFAIDSNLLVYAHNDDSEFNERAAAFLERAMNERDEGGSLSVCIPSQVLTEFVNVVTRKSLKKPLSLGEAISTVNDYLKGGVEVLNHRETQTHTFLELLGSITTRRKIFDVALAATLKDNGVTEFYTANTDDFEDFDFLRAVNPLKSEA